ncbi:MAG TPA: glycosyltransferase [Stellaceae bacterium]|nr:glycosyltransferase [Stellaceae bacterium]
MEHDPPIRVANFMDSRLDDLHRKGVLASAPGIYNPERAYSKVVHFSPYPSDISYAAPLAAGGIDLMCYDPRPRHPLRALRSIIGIVNRIRREKINIIRGRSPYAGSLIGCIIGRLLGIPSVVSLGGDNRIAQELNDRYLFNSRLISYRMEWLVLRLCNRIIVPNRFTKSYVAGIIGSRAAEKCAVIPWISEEAPASVIDVDTLRARLSLPPGRQIVPIIAFLNRYKFTNILYEALAEPRDDLVFVFCGDGPLRSEGEARFANRDDVRFIGWQDRAVVHSLIRAAPFVLVPMSGFVLLETASAGKPVITTRVEWHSELVEDGVSGFVVEPTDIMQWRRAISAMHENRDRALAMGRALHQRYEREYRPQRSRALELALYEELIQPKRRHTDDRVEAR